MNATRALALGLVLALAGCAGPSGDGAASPATPTVEPVSGPPVRLEPWLDGFTMPLLVTHDGEPGEVFVVEQTGVIWRIHDGAREPWLDLTTETTAAGERGLLGFAPSPDDARAYVSYTDRDGDSVLERVVDGARERLLFVDQPYGNHNGGHLAFGPDGMLYLGLGDGGSAGDPQGNGQNKDALLGSLLRLDVSADGPPRIPPGNPYGTEVYAKGLRNPWRFSFDRATGDLYIADVGQQKIEEMNFVPAGQGAGKNFGWSAYEGDERYGLLRDTFSEHTPPVAQYTHDDGCSITGGYVYRGDRHPRLLGAYFFGDYCSGKIWAMKRDDEGAWRVAEILDTDLRISSFGEDAEGELYVVHYGGSIHRLVGTGARMPFG